MVKCQTQPQGESHAFHHPWPRNTLENSLWLHACLFWTATLPVHDCGHRQLRTASEGQISVPQWQQGHIFILMRLKRSIAMINSSSRYFRQRTEHAVCLPLSHLPGASDEIPRLAWTGLLRLTELLFLDGNLPSYISKWEGMSRSDLHRTGCSNPVQKWLFPKFASWHSVSFPAPILLHRQEDTREFCLKKRAWFGYGWQASLPHVPSWQNLPFHYRQNSTVQPVLHVIVMAVSPHGLTFFASRWPIWFQPVFMPQIEQEDQVNNYLPDMPINPFQQTLTDHWLCSRH